MGCTLLVYIVCWQEVGVVLFVGGLDGVRALTCVLSHWLVGLLAFLIPFGVLCF